MKAIYFPINVNGFPFVLMVAFDQPWNYPTAPFHALFYNLANHTWLYLDVCLALTVVSSLCKHRDRVLYNPPSVCVYNDCKNTITQYHIEFSILQRLT